MTSSGMAAIATTLLTLVRAGDRVVAARQVYGDTPDLLVRDLPGWGIDVVQVDAADLDAWADAVAGGPTTVVYAETLANPQLELTDVAGGAAIAREAGARLVVDNTFATPYLVKPLSLGADVVVHSATKFLNGHSDVIAGAVVGAVDLVREVQRRVVTLGTCLDAHAAYQVWRGLQTFEVRMTRQCASAAAVAEGLRGSPEVVDVRYPAIGGDGGLHRGRRRRAGGRGDPPVAGRQRGDQPRRGGGAGQRAVQLLALLPDAGGAAGRAHRRRHDPALGRPGGPR